MESYNKFPDAQVRGGLVVTSGLQGWRVPVSKPDSLRSAVYVGPVYLKSDVLGQPSSSWCGEAVWRGRSQFRSCHLRAVQNYEVRPKIAFELLQNGT
ncbi:hypothetical protein AVEN_62910-1 [Araneus ventricosus]|nr:hypothetical protein AVEN_62910-1 [Araneus ventricosus]